MEKLEQCFRPAIRTPSTRRSFKLVEACPKDLTPKIILRMLNFITVLVMYLCPINLCRVCGRLQCEPGVV